MEIVRAEEFYSMISKRKQEQEQKLQELVTKMTSIREKQGDEYTKTLEFQTLVYERMYLSEEIRMLDGLNDSNSLERIESMGVEETEDNLTKFPCASTLENVSGDPKKAVEASILMTRLTIAYDEALKSNYSNKNDFEEKKSELQQMLGKNAYLPFLTPFISLKQYDNLKTIAESRVWKEKAQIIQEVQNKKQL